MSKSKYPQFTTGRGVASYPWLNKPDTQFNEQGVFKVNLNLAAEQFAPLKEAIDNYLKSFHTHLEKEKGKKIPLGTLRVPYEENEDGSFTLKIKQNAVINGDPVRLAFFDAKGGRLEKAPAIYGGSELRLSGSMRAYDSGANKGVTLGLFAVQVLKLAESTASSKDAQAYGFGEEEGFTMSDDAPPGFESDDSAGPEDDQGFDF